MLWGGGTGDRLDFLWQSAETGHILLSIRPKRCSGQISGSTDRSMNQGSSKIDIASETAENGDDSGPSSSTESEQPPARSVEPDRQLAVDNADGTGEPALTVDFPKQHEDERIDARWVRDRLREALRHINASVHRIAVMLVDDIQMARLHEVHRGENSTTDVLTFQTSGLGAPIDADIAVCVDEAARSAALRDHTIQREALLYALHGVLHCAGFDDHTEEQLRAMHAEEDRILEAIGVGATFGRDVSGHDDDHAAISRDRGSTL